MEVFQRKRRRCAGAIESHVPNCRQEVAEQRTAEAGSVVTFVHDDGSRDCRLLADPGSPLATAPSHGFRSIVSMRSPLGSAIEGAMAGERRMYLFAGRVRSVSITGVEPA